MKKRPNYFKKPGNTMEIIPAKEKTPDDISNKDNSRDEIMYSNSNLSASEINQANVQKDMSVSENSKTIISGDTQIIGNIKTRGDLDLIGTIEGNVDIEGQMTLSGTVSGNVSAGNIIISAGKLTGEYLQVKGSVRINEGSNVECDVTADSLETCGYMKGDIKAVQSVVINETAIIDGNIAAKFLTVKEGAVIKGIMEIGEATKK